MLYIVTIYFMHRYATEVDVDFVRKSVRAIGRCAIKVEVSIIVLMSDINLYLCSLLLRGVSLLLLN